MKLIVTTILLAMCSVAAAAACSDADRKTLEAWDRAWAKAGQNGDKNALMAIYADDYAGFPAMETKQSAIDNTMRTFEENRSNPSTSTATYDHYLINCSANTATVTHRNTITEKGPDGKESTFYSRSVHILEKRGGRWQVVGNAGNALDDYGTIWYMEQDWNDAILKKDKAWFEKNYASDFTSISSTDARLLNRAQAIADDTDPKVTIEIAETTGMNIRVDGNTAIVTGVFRLKGRDDKAAFDRRIRYTDTWIKRDGRWQAWSSQGTVIP